MKIQSEARQLFELTKGNLSSVLVYTLPITNMNMQYHTIMLYDIMQYPNAQLLSTVAFSVDWGTWLQ